MLLSLCGHPVLICPRQHLLRPRVHRPRLGAHPIRASMTLTQTLEEQAKDFDSEACWRSIWHTTEHSTRYHANCGYKTGVETRFPQEMLL